MERRISTDIYIAAFVISVLLFCLGVYIGMVIDESAKGEVESELRSLEEDLYLSRVLLLVEDEFGEFCPIYSEKLWEVDAERELIGDRLEYLETVRGITDGELRMKYYYLEFENYLLMKKMQKDCDDKSVLVLYFYDDSPDSIEQGQVLDALRASNGNVRVFSFEGESDAAVVQALKDQYLVTRYPTVVVDGKKQLGLKDLSELEGIIG